MLAGLHLGTNVSVFYDPRRPQLSVLRPGVAGAEELARSFQGGLLMLAGELVVLAVELSTGLGFFDALRSWLA